MDIASFSTLASQASLASQVSVAVAKISMDAMKQNTAELTKMLESSVEPLKGASIDIRL